MSLQLERDSLIFLYTRFKSDSVVTETFTLTPPKTVVQRNEQNLVIKKNLIICLYAGRRVLRVGEECYE